MKHLHLQFVLACVALGLGLCFLCGAVMTVRALPLAGGTPVSTFASAELSCMIGVILLAYGYHGVRREFLHPRPR